MLFLTKFIVIGTTDILANACLIYSISLNQINNEQRIALFCSLRKGQTEFLSFGQLGDTVAGLECVVLRKQFCSVSVCARCAITLRPRLNAANTIIFAATRAIAVANGASFANLIASSKFINQNKLLGHGLAQVKSRYNYLTMRN